MASSWARNFLAQSSQQNPCGIWCQSFQDPKEGAPCCPPSPPPFLPVSAAQSLGSPAPASRMGRRVGEEGSLSPRERPSGSLCWLPVLQYPLPFVKEKKAKVIQSFATGILLASLGNPVRGRCHQEHWSIQLLSSLTCCKGWQVLMEHRHPRGSQGSSSGWEVI